MCTFSISFFQWGNVFWSEWFWGEKSEKCKKVGAYWFGWGVFLVQLYIMQRSTSTVIDLDTGGYSEGIYKGRSDT